MVLIIFYEDFLRKVILRKREVIYLYINLVVNSLKLCFCILLSIILINNIYRVFKENYNISSKLIEICICMGKIVLIILVSFLLINW